MKLSDFMVADAITAELSSQNRDEVIRELVGSLANAGQISAGQVQEISQKIIERENQGSTGIGKGIAVPHIKHESVNAA